MPASRYEKLISIPKGIKIRKKEKENVVKNNKGSGIVKEELDI